MGFAGRFHPSSAPTVANEPMNTTATAPSAGLPPCPDRLAGSGYSRVRTRAVIDTATVTAQTDHARQKAIRVMSHRIIPGSRSRIVTRDAPDGGGGPDGSGQAAPAVVITQARMRASTRQAS